MGPRHPPAFAFACFHPRAKGFEVLALHHRITSRLRFSQYRREWGRRTQEGTGGGPGPREAAARHRSLPRLYRGLYSLLEGQRGAVVLALATASFSTLLKLV